MQGYMLPAYTAWEQLLLHAAVFRRTACHGRGTSFEAKLKCGKWHPMERSQKAKFPNIERQVDLVSRTSAMPVRLPAASQDSESVQDICLWHWVFPGSN